MLKHLTRVALVAAALTVAPILAPPAQAAGWEGNNQPYRVNPHDGRRYDDDRHWRRDHDRRSHSDRYERRRDRDRHHDRDRDRNDNPADFLQDLFN